MDNFPEPLRGLAAFNTSPHNSPMVRELVEEETRALRAEAANLRTEYTRQWTLRHQAEGTRDEAVAWCHEVRKAGFWTRLKWVFTGMVL